MEKMEFPFISWVFILRLKLAKLNENFCSINIWFRLYSFMYASLPPTFWRHDLQMTTYLLNILPNKNLNYQSRLKISFQNDPSYSYLRVFYCLCYPFFPSTKINKLQSRSTSRLFLGYPSNHHNYKYYNLSLNKIIICHRVIF